MICAGGQFSCVYFRWIEPRCIFPPHVQAIFSSIAMRINCQAAAGIWNIIHFHWSSLGNPHILHCPSIIYWVYEIGIKTFTLVNSAGDPGWKGPGLHFIIILNFNARRAKEFNFRDCLPSYLRDKMSVCPRHISRTCNYILQGKMWPELLLYSVSLVKRFSYRFLPALGQPCECALSDLVQDWS